MTPAFFVFSFSFLFLILLSLLSGSVFVLWLFMEVSVVLFIGVMCCDGFFSAGASAKYFLSQAFLGLSFFFFFQVGIWLPSEVSGIFFLGILLCKLGVAPFHFWVPGVVRHLSPTGLFFLLGPQKLLPLLLVGWGVSGEVWSFSLVGVCGVVSAILGLDYFGFNELMAFASMVSVVWVFLLFALGGTPGILSFFLYCVLIFVTLESKSILSLVLVAGAPPGPMFLMKWLCLCFLVSAGASFWVLLAFVMSAILVIPLYVKLVWLLLAKRGQEATGLSPRRSEVLTLFSFLVSLFIFAFFIF